MPWKKCSVMDERLRLVARLLDGEAMSDGHLHEANLTASGRPTNVDKRLLI